MSEYILGVSAFYHDSAVALLRDGEVVAAAQEERFSRHKGDASFPQRAMRYCLREAGIHPGQIQNVAFYESPYTKLERLLETYLEYAPRGFESFSRALPSWASLKLKLEDELRGKLGDRFGGRIWFLDHHDSHAASAFFPSPFEEAAILTLDAVGEWTTSAVGVGQHDDFRISHETRFPHSLGMLYSAFTHYAGFKVNSGEYKLMGLAPYGRPRFVDRILEHIVELGEDGSLWLDMSYFNYCQGLTMTSERFHALFWGTPREPETEIKQRDMDLAASIQAVCEEAVLRAGRHAHALTERNNLVMAGGVALNCVANGRLRRNGPFERIWVQPAAGDAGGALGAALLVWHRKLEKPRIPRGSDSQKGSLLGPSFENDEIRLFLDSIGASYERLDDEQRLIDRVVELLVQEKVVGWFQGRMEYGPRALGSRSIIGDARAKTMQQVMNLKIKFRESFRPFAPCVLREHAHQVFAMEPEEDSPYMLFVAPVRESWRVNVHAGDQQRVNHPDLRIRVSVPRSRIPAVTHVDYSARVQTVDESRHGRFYRLMRRFQDRTGCPVLVNTSFNIRGEPIVCTPEDAYRCFMATDMDCLVVEDFVLFKAAQAGSLLFGLDEYRSRQPLD